MVQDGLRGWLGHPERLPQGDRAAIEGLFTGLTLVGLAMEAHGSSRPASGADHQIAHLWEMEDLSLGSERVSHGACVAVGAAAMLDLYFWVLDRDLTRIDPAALVAGAPDLTAKARLIDRAFGEGEIAARARIETERKHPAPAVLHARLDRLRMDWPELSARLRTQVMPPDAFRSSLRAAGAPATAAEIGVTPDHLRRTIANARFLRERYTLLDLLDETGMLPTAIAETTGADVPTAASATWRRA
jgi:glycerol-1-phosphate dehydrogenase [NAD(P)+]